MPSFLRTKKSLFIVLSLKKLAIVFICVTLFVSAIIILRQNEIRANTALIGLTVVIDAGHGGRDSGTTGAFLKVREADINLAVARKLESHLRRAGFRVIQTRPSTAGLYDPNSSNRKKSDMQRRREIINRSDADLVVSIHQNSFSMPSVHGAGVFYNIESPAGKTAALKIERELLRINHITKTQNKPGNFYILEGTNIPSVLIECAFLSNREDEAFIASTRGQEKIAFAIFCGIIRFFGVENY